MKIKLRYLALFLAFTLWGCTVTPEKPTESTASSTSPIAVLTVPPTEEIPTTVPVTTAPPDPVEVILQSMTTEELVGQLFLARCPSDTAIEDIQKYHLGGYLLFARDFQEETPDSMRQKLASYQSASTIPMLIAVDEEGGTVTRVSANAAFRDSRFPSPRSLYAEGGMDRVLEVEAEKAELLYSLGIRVNMAPVCDVTTDSNAFMYARSLGLSPELTGTVISHMTATMRQHHIGSVLKHFPGYGNNADTHTGIAIDDRPLSELEAADLVPFAYGISAGCDAILVSHTIVSCLDEQMPASLSPSVHGYLRNNMNFSGVIVTDDLVMQAITDQYGSGEAAVLAVLAGNDLLCATDYGEQYRAVLEAVESGRISRETLLSSVRKVLQWKVNLGLLELF